MEQICLKHRPPGMAATGVPIMEASGLTETSPGVTANALNMADWTGAIGMPESSLNKVLHQQLRTR